MIVCPVSQPKTRKTPFWISCRTSLAASVVPTFISLVAPRIIFSRSDSLHSFNKQTNTIYYYHITIMRFSLSSLKNRRDSQSQTSKEYRISDFTKSLLQKQPRKSILLETSAIINENEQEEMNDSSSFSKTKKKKVRFPNNNTAVIIALAANSKLSGMCWWNMQDLQAIQQIAQNQAKKLATSKEAADVSYRKALQKFYQMTNSSTTNTTNTTIASSSDASILEASFARDLRRRLHNSQSRSGLEYQVLEHMGIALSKHRQTVLQSNAGGESLSNHDIRFVIHIDIRDEVQHASVQHQTIPKLAPGRCQDGNALIRIFPVLIRKIFQLGWFGWWIVVGLEKVLGKLEHHTLRVVAAVVFLLVVVFRWWRDHDNIIYCFCTSLFSLVLLCVVVAADCWWF